MIDTNIFLGRWPFRRLPLDQAADLATLLRTQGVHQAWAGSFEAVLHRDITAVNQRLVDECRRIDEELLLPIGALNLTLPDWQRDLQVCAEVHGMRGVRLHPNYHQYTLDDPRFEELLTLAEQAGLLVQLAVRMEDDRTQHPQVQVPDVDVAALPELLDAHPGLQVILINSLRTLRGAVLEELVQRPNSWFEISMLEGVGGLGKLLQEMPYERVLFGSYAPFFYWESAAMKLEESELGATIRSAIVDDNARRLLARASSD